METNFEYLHRIALLSSEVERHLEELREIRHKMAQMNKMIQKLAYEIRRVGEANAAAHSEAALRIELAPERLERRLSPA